MDMNLEPINAIDSKIYVEKCDFGKGVFAATNISKGEVILTFMGRLITAEQVWAKSGYPMQIASEAYIDIEEPGVFVNHACNPNAGIVSANLLIALRDIYKNQEIFG